ncbi:hypothetical protein LPJ53_000333 [Coemansia erecta]|uniref:Uncharacterized protein n=1 Tax=Coemansia erecta TaxID=147472 RepID=A0A9W8CVS6_9FUNG|nr:hypothetical protein LPJ53_000333 [Coemansia erecta]
MVRIQLSSLDEFVSSLSRLDYEAAKLASGKVMEDHIQMGALMFSLLTIEMMYTSMDYLAAGNFRRGNGYLLHMYTPLPLRLDRLLKKLVAEYEEERQRLMSARVQPAGDDGAAEGAAGGPDGRAPSNAPRRASGRAATDYFPAFDPNQFVQNTAAAARVAAELATVRKFVDFIGKFVEVRKTMVVLYRFVAVTGPVLHVRKLRLLLGHCAAVLESIEPDGLYGKLLAHVRGEVRLVGELVEWDAHVTAYDFARSVVAMQTARRLLRAWQADVVARGAEDGAAGGGPARDEAPGALYKALARSARLVQGFLWGGAGAAAGLAAGGRAGGGGGRMRGIAVWLDRWTAHLAFRTTAYFQRHLLAARALHTADALADVWRRPALSPDLSAKIGDFLRAFDGECVALLFASSAAHPFAPDGVAVCGTKQHVPLARVQACATLFCQRRRPSSAVGDDVHGMASAQGDAEWLRQNCLPDILCVVDAAQQAMDAELLGAAPLLDALGDDADADALLDELAGSVRDALAAAVVARATTRGTRRDSRDARDGRRHDRLRTPSQMAQPADEDSLYSTYLLKSHLRNNLTAGAGPAGAHESPDRASVDPMAIRIARARHPDPPLARPSTVYSVGGRGAAHVRRGSAGPAAGDLSLFAGRRDRRAPSIRSLLRPGAPPTAAAADSDVARRARRGERLAELFGGWDAEGTAHVAGGLEPALHVPAELAYSTPTRGSVGRRAHAGDVEGGLAQRLSRAAADSVDALDGYTYVYARVAMPNVTLVAVLVDSERAMARRREALRAWDAVVAAVRGTPLLDLLLTLA